MKGIKRKAVFTLIFIIISCIVMLYIKDSIYEYDTINLNTTNFEKWISSFGKIGIVIFVLLQILQVVVFFIPGEIMQAAGGYLYGACAGSILSLAGILMGSVITFIIARKFGNRFLEKILPRKDYARIKSLIQKPRNNLIIFVLYTLPGFPKDILGYAAGITTIKLRNFIIISTVGRMPALFLSSYFGANLYYKNYVLIIYLSAVIAVVFLIGVLYRERILSHFK